AFTFLYSVREGTLAAKMDNQVPDELKHERFDRLLDVLYPIILEKNKKCTGKVFPVLVESVEKGKLTGRTGQFKLIHFEGSSDLIGHIVNVKITEAKTFHMEGILVE
ncbi:MAG TPA: TRAM domain-containing protein, partial [Tissierellia bacterium]|nr:TRAM domain-containing protein [Tissierellia bacterium]